MASPSELGVGEHQRRVVAAELELDPRQALGGHAHDHAAGPHAAGEGDLADQRVLDQHRAEHLVAPADHVEHARRERGGDPFEVRTNASGVVGGALTTVVLPATSACGSEAPRIASGQLNGTMIETTPSGSRAIVVRSGGPSRVRTASTSSASSAASWKRPAITCRSMSASPRTLPFSRDSSSTRAS